MAYVDGLLVSGETVVRREQQHWILPFYTAGRWVALALGVMIVSFLVNWILIPSGGGFVGAISTLLTWVTLIALAIGAVGFAWSAARWKSQEYVLTNQRVIHVSGVITKQSSDSVLESLSDARIEIPLLGRMMGWGNLVLITANESGNVRMLALRDPVAFKKAVLETKNARTLAMNPASHKASAAASAVVEPPRAPALAPAPVPAAHASGEDVTRTLTALAGLRDSGAITPEEYKAKKKELLARI